MARQRARLKGLWVVWVVCGLLVRAMDICLINMSDNPRIASVWTRGLLQRRYGSEHKFTLVKPREGCSPSQERVRLVKFQQLSRWCVMEELCIVVGDERCKAPNSSPKDLKQWLHKIYGVTAGLDVTLVVRHYANILSDVTRLAISWDESYEDFDEEPPPPKKGAVVFKHKIDPRLRPTIVMREFYSSKYDYPSISLGARFEFKPVPDTVRDAGNRPLMFNFMGSVETDKEPDRVRLKHVIESHEWSVPTHFVMYDQLVKEPNASSVEEYRDTLIASSFTLAPVGTADDCFRFWEAIEAGSVPIFVRRKPSNKHCPDAFEDVLRSQPPIVILEVWSKLPRYIARVTEEEISDRRRRLVQWNFDWWANTTERTDKALREAILKRNKAKEKRLGRQIARNANISSAVEVFGGEPEDQVETFGVKSLLTKVQHIVHTYSGDDNLDADLAELQNGLQELARRLR